MDDNNNFTNYSDFEYVSRKSKGRRRSKTKANLRVNVEEKSENSESLDVDNPSIVEELQKINSNTTRKIIVGSPIENEVDNQENYFESADRISTDALLKREPSYQSLFIQGQSDRLGSNDLKEAKVNDNVEEIVTEEKETYNVRALPKYAETYQLETFEKNVLIIFNQENIEGYKPRYGTDKDVEALKNTFGKFAFEVTEYKDLTKKEISDTLDSFTSLDFTDYGCVGIAVLTHGLENGLLRAKDQPYSEIEIINYFKVHDKPTLVTKPKFLIIQACRGPEVIPGAAVLLSSKIRTDLDSSKEPYILPVEADMLILHSSFIRSPSYRDEVYGSWFIQSFCNKISKLATTHDIESIITEVKRDVAIEKEHEIYNKRTLEMQVNKQMPVMTSTLIRKLYFKKFGDPPVSPLSIPDGGKCHDCQNTSNEVLDSVPPFTPTVPLLVQYGPCMCFLDHFDYMKKCIKYFVDDNPDDEVANSYLELAETFEDGDKFNASKEKLTKAMSKHLTTNAKDCDYYKYLYFYKIL